MKTNEKQKGLNEVVTAHVSRRIAERQDIVSRTMERFESECKMAQDYIVAVGNEQRSEVTGKSISFKANERLTMSVGRTPFSLHPHAVGQIAEKVGVPAKYLRDLAEGSEWQRKLAAKILNDHTEWTQRDRLLVRTVDKQVRGVLSDSYRRMNSLQIVQAFINVALRYNAVICDAFMNDTKIAFETILPEPISVETPQNGEVVVFVGARFSTSDFGDGALDIRAFLLNDVCLNGMVRESCMRKVHLGKRLPDDLRLSADTYRKESAVIQSAVKDITHQLYRPENITKITADIQAASSVDVDFRTEIQRLVKNNKLLKAEGEEVQKLLMENNPQNGTQGASTLWKLTQAITAHARNLDPVRTRELHEVSGELMNRLREHKQ